MLCLCRLSQVYGHYFVLFVKQEKSDQVRTPTSSPVPAATSKSCVLLGRWDRIGLNFHARRRPD